MAAALGKYHTHRYYSPAVLYLLYELLLSGSTALALRVIGAGCKPSTWSPPGRFTELCQIQHTRETPYV